MQTRETIVATYIRQDGGKKTHHILVDDTLANLRTAKNMGLKQFGCANTLNKGRFMPNKFLIVRGTLILRYRR